MDFRVFDEHFDDTIRLPEQILGLTELLLDLPITQGHITDPYWIGPEGFQPLRTSMPMHRVNYRTVAEALGMILGDYAQRPDHDPTDEYFGVAIRARVHLVDDDQGHIHLRRAKLGGSIPDPDQLSGSTPADIAHVYVVGHPPAQGIRAHGARHSTLGAIDPDTDSHRHATTITDALYATGSRNPDEKN